MPRLNSQQFTQPSLFPRSRQEVGQPTTEDRYHEEMQNYARGGVVQVNAPVREAHHVLDDEEILSQHHTGTSQGSYTPDFRYKWETAQGISNPIYGSVQTPGVSQLHRSDEGQYGAVGMQLSRSVRPRTTIMHGDSLGETAPVVPIEDVASGRSNVSMSASVLDRRNHYDRDVERQAFVDNPTALGSFKYVEAQVEPTPGRLGVGLEEVRGVEMNLPERAVLNEPGFNQAQKTQERMEVGQRFEDQGIPVNYTREEQTYQPPLPASASDLRAQGFSGGSDFWARPADPDDPYGPAENLQWTRKRRRHGRDI